MRVGIEGGAWPAARGRQAHDGEFGLVSRGGHARINKGTFDVGACRQLVLPTVLLTADIRQ